MPQEKSRIRKTSWLCLSPLPGDNLWDGINPEGHPDPSELLQPRPTHSKDAAGEPNFTWFKKIHLFPLDLTISRA